MAIDIGIKKSSCFGLKFFLIFVRWLDLFLQNLRWYLNIIDWLAMLPLQ